ncbi:hypothetical protein F5X68DRAFT_215633 [Plectosphaerella plurivora]|uniref:Uncharacterized protein n=1 Tax=Plectosphaerella plurivora TaxID=936078 RepID=A0A9P8V3N8_9PEZI|nr:hypothetical protein F5X68DRAFT_215633 [Plectosphaerella plurivora]
MYWVGGLFLSATAGFSRWLSVVRVVQLRMPLRMSSPGAQSGEFLALRSCPRTPLSLFHGYQASSVATYCLRCSYSTRPSSSRGIVAD